MATGTASLRISIAKACSDGKFYGRYPDGHNPFLPIVLGGVASDIVTASAALRTGARFAGAASDVTTASASFGTAGVDSKLLISGNKFTNSQGAQIQLRGVNVSGMETVPIQGWSPSDPFGGNMPSTTALASWKLNVVRVPLNEAALLGGQNAFGCPGFVTFDMDGVMHIPDPGNNYLSTCVSIATTLNAAGFYCLFDMHWTAPGNIAPMQQDSMANVDNTPAAIAVLAALFASNKMVAIETFNEPFLDLLGGSFYGPTGVATGGSTTTIVDSAQTWAVNMWAGQSVTCNGHTATITSNTATTLTFAAMASANSAGMAYSLTATAWQLLMQGGTATRALGFRPSTSSGSQDIQVLQLSNVSGQFFAGDVVTQGSASGTVVSYHGKTRKLYLDKASITGTFSTSGTLSKTSGKTGMALITRGTGAIPTPKVSSNTANAANLTAGNANSTWRSSGTGAQWAAFDVSTKTAAGTKSVLIEMLSQSYSYNGQIQGGYGTWNTGAPGGSPPANTGNGYYNVFGDYQIQTNTAAGGGAAPTTGWTTVYTITANNFTQRHHLLSLTGSTRINWIRIYVTGIAGTSGNMDCDMLVNMWDATNGVSDGWYFCGDSYYANFMRQANLGDDDGGSATCDSFQNLAHAAGGYYASYYPPQLDCGIPGFNTAQYQAKIDQFLLGYPGRFVMLGLGTNDLPNYPPNGNDATASFYASFVQIINSVLNAGKIPIIPTICYTPDAQHTTGLTAYNAQIANLQALPGVVTGPDMYAFTYAGRATYFNGTELHPNAVGDAAIRTKYAQFAAALTNVATANVTNANAGFAVAGHQQLINSVRSTAFTGPLLVSGLAYANDMSGWLANKPTDPLGQMAAAQHPYPPCQTVTGVSISAGGSGHAVNNVITMTQPNGCMTPLVVKVTAVSGGVVTGVSINNSGSYLQATSAGSALPGTVSQGSSTGGGTGLVLSVTSWANSSAQPSLPSNRGVTETIALTYPVIATETGDSTKSGNQALWIPDVTAWFDSKGISGIAWAWNVWGDPSNVLISDTSGTPVACEGVAWNAWTTPHA